MSKLPKSALSLKQVQTHDLTVLTINKMCHAHQRQHCARFYFQFMLRQEVLKLYREIFRITKYVPDKTTQSELRDWARTDFRNNMYHEDETTIKALLHHGKKSLKDLQHSLALSKS